MVRLTNISGGLHVCDLKDGSTLRLNNKQSETYEDGVITKHIRNLVSKGLFRLEEVKEVKETKQPTEKSVAKKEKEEKQNGNV